MIDAYLDQLYEEGCRNDSDATDHSEKMLNITPSTGAFLDLLVSDAQPKRILELGTSNGYSTIWIARAASRVGARFDTVDHSCLKRDAAKGHLKNTQLIEHVRLYQADGGEFLRQADGAQYDFVFLDSDRSFYSQWASDLVRVTRFGWIVVDNAISHQEELREFRRLIIDEFELHTMTLPIGKGQMVICSA